MIRAGRVTGGRADAAVCLGDEGGIVQPLVVAITPQLGSHALMQPLGESLGQAVRQGLEHDGVVVVVRCVEARHMPVESGARRYRKCAHVVGDAGVALRDEVGEAAVMKIGAFAPLLAQVIQAGHDLVAGLLGIDLDIVAARIGRKQSRHARRSQPALIDEPGQQPLRILVERPARLAHRRIIQYLRKSAMEFPGVEERHPVDAINQFGQRIVVEPANPGVPRHRRPVLGPVDGQPVGARLGEREFRPASSPRLVASAAPGVFAVDPLCKLRAPFTDQRQRHVD